MKILTRYSIIILLAAILLPNLSYGANKNFYGTYEVKSSVGSCTEPYYLTIGGDKSRISEDRYLYVKSKGKSFTQNTDTISINNKKRTISYSWSDTGDAGSIVYTFSKKYKNGTVSGEITAGTCIGTITGTFSRGIQVDWRKYLNYQVGRAWQYNRTINQNTYPTFSEYIKEITTKGGEQNVYVLGWSSNYSDWLDYRIFRSDGVYFVGFYDDEDLLADVIFPKPILYLRNNFIFGKTYTSSVAISNKQTINMTTKYELVNGITVPYGTYDDVIKVTWIVDNGKGDNKIYWYAKNIGMIREIDNNKNKIVELRNITDGAPRPVD